MIPARVRNIFTFIEFLESNKKEYLERYVPLTNMMLQLSDERSKLRPSNNYKEKQQYDAIQKKMEEPCSVINNNVVKPILQRLLDLKIWDGDGACASIWDNNAGAISELIRNFTNADIEEVKKYKQMYLTFRAETNQALELLYLTFDSLDEVLKDLFDFFKDTKRNEFEEFEVHSIQVNSVKEMAELVQKGHKKFELPFSISTFSKLEERRNEGLQNHYTIRNETTPIILEQKYFEREFGKANIPFEQIINKDALFKTGLFDQYRRAETKPCFDLYLAEFYSEEELKQGFEEVHKQIPVSHSRQPHAANFVTITPFENHIMELNRQFIDLVVRDNLPSTYYCPEIEKTVIVQALRAINNEHEFLKKSVFDESIDKYKESEVRSENIVGTAEQLKGFAHLIIDQLRRDNENIYLHLKEADKTKVDFWQALKSYFNNALSKSQALKRQNVVEKQGFSYMEKKESGLPKSEFSEAKKEQTKLSQQEIQCVFAEIKSLENKFWKGLPMEQVLNHFEVMTSRKSKNGNAYLTPEQLISFLKRGFLDDATQPVQKINCSNGEKGFVIKRFYQLWDIAVSQYGHPQKKERFISLFTDCFDNWEPHTIQTWFKSNKTKENW